MVAPAEKFYRWFNQSDTFPSDPRTSSEIEPGDDDDSIGRYLSEMGRTSLLTRAEELELATQLDHHRNRFRVGMLRIGFVTRAILSTMDEVRSAQRRADRALNFSVGDAETKRDLLSRLPHNLATAHRLADSIADDFRKLATRRSVRRRRALARHIIRCREKNVRLIEELRVRLPVIESHFDEVLHAEE